MMEYRDELEPEPMEPAAAAAVEEEEEEEEEEAPAVIWAVAEEVEENVVEELSPMEPEVVEENVVEEAPMEPEVLEEASELVQEVVEENVVEESPMEPEVVEEPITMVQEVLDENQGGSAYGTEVALVSNAHERPLGAPGCFATGEPTQETRRSFEPVIMIEEEKESAAIEEEVMNQEDFTTEDDVDVDVDITDIYPNNNQEIQEENPNSSTVVVEEQSTEDNDNNVPKIVFIVPYRNRQVYQEIFDNKMKNIILCDMPKHEYKIYYIHQIESVPFNRGAMKNIGFFMVKDKYPHHYKNITLVFNDVDTTPSLPKTIPSYETRPGVVKHFYGMRHALGGIVSINAGDFESINGFPNYWTWGYEDNMLNKRVIAKGLRIDRSIFYQMNDREHIQQMTTTNLRMVNQGEFDRYARNVDEGLNTILDLKYMTNEENGFVDVTHFNTAYNYNPNLSRNYDITTGKNTPFNVGYSGRRGSRLNMVITSEI